MAGKKDGQWKAFWETVRCQVCKGTGAFWGIFDTPSGPVRMRGRCYWCNGKGWNWKGFDRRDAVYR